jgi:DNA invertase Pin-like site-specific DNA recombinase
MMHHKIQSHHHEKHAYVYLRQSTMSQVRLNRESTERQYALKDRAESLGWPQHKVIVLDNDLGLSGASTNNRDDFKTLVADVSMGKVGAVFALEASRLSRSCTDWHRLLEICALTHTLIIDEDGCYNPSDFNDQLLLGLKGTMSQAELHFIRARLQGGKVNKAKKGELHFPLPVGYCYDHDGRTIFDHDEQVRETIALLFKVFKEKGSAYAVAHYFANNNLKFPKRAYGGVWKGKLIWGQLTLTRTLAVLKNPSYAGTYVYGRYHYEKFLSQEGTLQARMIKRPQNDWQVTIHEHHDGYITWDDFLENQIRLERNQTNGKDNLLPGPVREGLALLHGLLVCSYCGHKITVRYQGHGGIAPYYQCSWKRKEGGTGTKDCLSIRCEPVDETVSQRILSVIKPKQIQIAISALDELENRQQGLNKQWELKLQRAQYEVDLAERRYEEVDPANRLVAATLEKRWDEALNSFHELQKQQDAYIANNQLAHLSSKKEELLKLAQDFPKLWSAPSTSAKDRKRIVRLLIQDITVKITDDRKRALLYVRWQGGASEELYVTLPRKSSEKWRHSPEIIERVRDLALTLSDQEIANLFNQEGLKTNKDNPYTVPSIQWIRYQFKIPSYNLRKPGEISINEMAQKFNVSHYVVRYWIDRGIINARKANGHIFWISLTPEKEEELLKKVDSSTKIRKAREIKSQQHTEGDAL